MFANRTEAGAQLAKKLSSYSRDKGVVVLGIPRGGVAVAKEISTALHLPLSVLVIRKLGAPSNPELAIGAVANDGKPVWNTPVLEHLRVSETYPREELARQLVQVRRRMQLFGLSNRFPVHDKLIILVDDGIATGATVKAAISILRKQKVKKIVLAVPVCSGETAVELAALVDEFVCLERPTRFEAVGEFYEDFRQVSDADVKALLNQAG